MRTKLILCRLDRLWLMTRAVPSILSALLEQAAYSVSIVLVFDEKSSDVAVDDLTIKDSELRTQDTQVFGGKS